ncbi:hypothetical protein ACJJTC_007778 [Scirpophaga incertulas]
MFYGTTSIRWLYYAYDKKRTDVRWTDSEADNRQWFMVKRKSLAALLKVAKYLEDTYNRNVLAYIFSKRYILTSDPKFIEEIVSSTKILSKDTSYYFLRPWLGNGLLTSTGIRWKAHRKFLTPAFHFNILQNFLPVFCKNGKVLIEKLQNHADGTAFNMLPFIALAALDNVTESIMGVSFNAQGDKDAKFVKAVNDISSIAFMRMRNIFVYLDILFNLSPYKKIQDEALKILHGETRKVISARREQLQNSNFVFDPESKNKHAFLDLLLFAEVDGKRISDEYIREEVDTFMFEGHDTTMSGITFCLYSLSQNEHIQEKVFLEQKSIFSDDLDRNPSFSDIQQMKYLDLVIKETLRLYPSVPLIGREVLEDTVINGLRIPKDTSIILDFFNMQRHSMVYQDSLTFKPERFEDTTRDPFIWLPFSAGPRNCIGQKFATLEMKATVSEVVRHFRLLPADETPELCADLILRSHNGVKMRLLPRK